MTLSVPPPKRVSSRGGSSQTSMAVDDHDHREVDTTLRLAPPPYYFSRKSHNQPPLRWFLPGFVENDIVDTTLRLCPPATVIHPKKPQKSKNQSRKIPKTDQPCVVPEEIIEEILFRLDVTSLLRFRCVSKSYRSLIDSQRFIEIHLRKATTDTTLAHHSVLFFSRTYHEAKASRCSLVSFLDNPNNSNNDSKLNIFPTNISRYYKIRVVGCCNGLVCIMVCIDKNSSQFILWNPSTRISKKLPEFDMNIGWSNFKCYGFGWDESSDDYKVIMVVGVDESPSTAKLYSSKSDSWKQIDSWDIDFVPNKLGELASGKLHWVRKDSTDPYESEIVAFNLKREVFESVPCYSGGCYMPFLGTFGECLALLCTYEDDPPYENDYQEIWVMKKREGEGESTWEKVMLLHDDNEHGVIWTCPSVAASCNAAKGDIILMNINYNTTYLAYDLKNHCIRYPGLSTDPTLVYVESLISPFRI